MKTPVVRDRVGGGCWYREAVSRSLGLCWLDSWNRMCFQYLGSRELIPLALNSDFHLFRVSEDSGAQR